MQRGCVCVIIGAGRGMPTAPTARNVAGADAWQEVEPMPQPRPNTTQRGYGAEHQQLRAHYVGLLAEGEVLECWRCFGEIQDPDDMHVGHDDHDRSITRGPEHRLCNLRAAADKANGKSPTPERHPRSRVW